MVAESGKWAGKAQCGGVKSLMATIISQDFMYLFCKI